MLPCKFDREELRALPERGQEFLLELLELLQLFELLKLFESRWLVTFIMAMIAN